MKRLILFDNDKEIKFTVPQTWNDVSFKMYIEYVNTFSKTDETADNRKLIEIFCGLTREQVNSIEAGEMYSILGMLQKLVKQDIASTKDEYFKFDGQFYDLKDLKRMTAGQFEDIRELIGNNTDVSQYALILAVFIANRINGKYDSKNVEGIRTKIEELPCTIVVMAGFFFWNNIKDFLIGTLNNYPKQVTRTRKFRRVFRKLKSVLGR